jgi:predicted membrane protein
MKVSDANPGNRQRDIPLSKNQVRRQAMRNRGQLIFGGILILFGLLALFESLFNIDIGAIFWPLVLIAVGALLMLRPRFAPPGSEVWFRFFGGVNRKGVWQVRNEEVWMFIGDVRLDLTQAELPPGESTFQVSGFIGDIDLIIPAGTAVDVHSNGFITSAKWLGNKQDHFLTPAIYTSPGYELAERKLKLRTNFFITDLTAIQGSKQIV